MTAGGFNKLTMSSLSSASLPRETGAGRLGAERPVEDHQLERSTLLAVLSQNIYFITF